MLREQRNAPISMPVKEAQMVNLHSEAQLANGLTKAKEHKLLMLFYQMHHMWRFVDDPCMASAKKRKEKGQAPLDNTNTSNDQQQQHDDNIQAQEKEV